MAEDNNTAEMEIIEDLEAALSETREVERPRVVPAPPAPQRRGRSNAFSGWRMGVAYLGVFAFVAYTLWTHITWGYDPGNLFLASFFTVIGVLITYFLLSAVHWRSFTHLPPAHGRVLAVIPVYNESTELVHEVVQSLLRQTILPDSIHVVDDGSVTPIEPFDDPLVTWHRTPNQGKREAQAEALRQYGPHEFDFIMTVDSDSVCDDDALEELLKSMSDERVQAATGMIFVRNWNTNLLTRLTDINVVTSCLLFRMARSILGIVSPTSGALALYRSEIVYDNLDDYLENGKQAGGAGDDRRLSFYALLRGHVVGVSEAVVATQLPDRVGACFRQRMRWSKSAWLGTPFVLTNMRWLMVLFYVFPLAFALMWPLVVTALTWVWIADGYGEGLYRGLIFWIVCSVTQTWVYMVYRPGLTLRQRTVQWMLSPIYPLFGMIILRPASYWALTKLKDRSWHTREIETDMAEAA